MHIHAYMYISPYLEVIHCTASWTAPTVKKLPRITYIAYFGVGP